MKVSSHNFVKEPLKDLQTFDSSKVLRGNYTFGVETCQTSQKLRAESKAKELNGTDQPGFLKISRQAPRMALSFREINRKHVPEMTVPQVACPGDDLDILPEEQVSVLGSSPPKSPTPKVRQLCMLSYHQKITKSHPKQVCKSSKVTVKKYLVEEEEESKARDSGISPSSAFSSHGAKNQEASGSNSKGTQPPGNTASNMRSSKQGFSTNSPIFSQQTNSPTVFQESLFGKRAILKGAEEYTLMKKKAKLLKDMARIEKELQKQYDESQSDFRA